jgi:hypothetical protein
MIALPQNADARDERGHAELRNASASASGPGRASRPERSLAAQPPQPKLLVRPYPKSSWQGGPAEAGTVANAAMAKARAKIIFVIVVSFCIYLVLSAAGQHGRPHAWFRCRARPHADVKLSRSSVSDDDGALARGGVLSRWRDRKLAADIRLAMNFPGEFMEISQPDSAFETPARWMVRRYQVPQRRWRAGAGGAAKSAPPRQSPSATVRISHTFAANRALI